MEEMTHDKSGRPYTRLLIMSFLSFAAMYALMYAMVDRPENVQPSLNQFYMAAMMTAPMVVFELLIMRAMYPDKKINVAVLAASALVLIASFLCIRSQVGISDREFLKSMIPHHAGALLMCQQANLSDPELKQLCQTIIAGQQTEIDQMKAKLKADRLPE